MEIGALRFLNAARKGFEHKTERTLERMGAIERTCAQPSRRRLVYRISISLSSRKEPNAVQRAIAANLRKGAFTRFPCLADGIISPDERGITRS
jgi:hypothetical protein